MKNSTIFLQIFECFQIASLNPYKGKPNGKNLGERKRVQSSLILQTFTFPHKYVDLQLSMKRSLSRRMPICKLSS